MHWAKEMPDQKPESYGRQEIIRLREERSALCVGATLQVLDGQCGGAFERALHTHNLSRTTGISGPIEESNSQGTPCDGLASTLSCLHTYTTFHQRNN
jgi:hypothetical protein